jgi:hypothetical protein
MKSNQKMQMRAHVRFSPSCVVVFQLEIECSSEDLLKYFLTNFSYSLDIEEIGSKEKASTFAFAVRENRTDKILCRIDSQKQVLEILASLCEQGFFIEEVLVRAGDREYSRTSDQKVSKSLRKSFSKIVENLVNLG